MSAPRLAALAALFLSSWARTAAAQDPPPPMIPPSDAPPPMEPAAPPSVPAAPAPAPPAPVEPAPAAPLPPAIAESPRSLKGHTFLPPQLVDYAFVTTHLGLSAELGRVSEPGVPQSGPSSSGGLGESFTYDRSLGLSTARIAFGAAVAERIEIGFDASYSAFLASDANTTVIFGSRNAWEVRPGVRIRAYRAPASGTQISVRIWGNFGSGTRQAPVSVLTAIAADASAIASDPNRVACLAAGDLACALPKGFDADASVRATRTVAAGGAGLAVAQSFGSRFGLQGSLGIEAGHAWVSTKNTGDVGSTPIAFHVGVAPSLDFGPSVPLALMLEYRFRALVEPAEATKNVPSGTAKTLEHGLAAGLYYTGRRELAVGAAFGATLSQNSVTYDMPVDLAPTRAITGQVTARYFF
jgi:hypothetical protein